MLKNYIAQLNKRGSIPGLDNIRRLLTRLGNPQENIPVIHVAGTNGKGSTIAFMEGILREAGFRVGKYTSPTIASYFERFQIDGKNMDEEVFYKLLSRVKQEADEMEAFEGLFPTAFEVETAVAFLYCQDVDIMLLETGMGGRLDSTNVVSKPLVTVMSSISMDHMAFLGDTLEKIAMEKAGILRAGVPCVSNPANIRVEKVLCGACEALGAPYISAVKSEQDIAADIDVQDNETQFLSKPDYHMIDADSRHTRFVFQGMEYEIYLPGLFQVENAVTAILAVQQACRYLKPQLAKDTRCIKRGLARAVWPFRLEHVAEEPDIYLDGAHNEDACIRLRESIASFFADRPKIFIVGVLKDKEYDKMMAWMMPLASGVFTVTPNNPRALEGSILAEVCQKYCGHAVSCDNLEQAVQQATALCERLSHESIECEENNGNSPVIIAFGSLSYLGELKKWIE